MGAWRVNFLPRGWPMKDEIQPQEFYVKNEPYTLQSDFTSSISVLKDAWQERVVHVDNKATTKVVQYELGTVTIKNEDYYRVDIKWVEETVYEKYLSGILQNNWSDGTAA